MKQIFLLLFLFFIKVGYSQANAGGDKAVCKGNAVTIGDMDNDPNYCYSWKASPFDPEIEKVKTSKIIVSPSETTIYTLTVVGQDFKSHSSDEVKVIVINEIKVKSVSFIGNKKILKDDGSGEYETPLWKADGGAGPVCYTAGDIMELSSYIELDQDLRTVNNVKVRGIGTNGYDINPTPIFGSDKAILFLGTPVKKKFPNQVDYFDAFEMKWQVSFDDEKTWCDVGTSKNQLYITLGKPIDDESLFHTVVHLGCSTGKGESTSTAILNKVWNVFANRNVKRVSDNFTMTYYGDWSTENNTTEKLLKGGDGMCRAWTFFLLDILKAQGINARSFVEVIPNVTDEENQNSYGFFVKNWKFIGKGISGDPDFPYLNIITSPDFINHNPYEWRFAEVIDETDGIPGQGLNNLNPASLFQNHQFAKINEKYFDASYGTNANTIAEVENNAIEAFFKIDPYHLVDEAKVNLDLNGDGKIEGSFTVPSILIKRNGSTQELKELSLTY